MMKKTYIFTLLLACLLWASLASAQTASRAFAWDYKTADLAAFNVTGFQTQIDNGTWTTIGMPPVIASTSPDVTSYAFTVPALTPGDHVFAVRACTANLGCSAGTPLSFSVTITVPQPLNVRVIDATRLQQLQQQIKIGGGQ